MSIIKEKLPEYHFCATRIDYKINTEQKKIKRNEVTVAFITGNGLKTLDAMGDFSKPVNTTPDLESFEAAIRNN